MTRPRTSALLATGLVLVALLGVCGSAQALVVHPRSGPPVGLVGRPAVSSSGGLFHSMLASGRDAAANVSYHGGPVLHSATPYLVGWDPAGSIPGSWMRLFSQYLTDSAQASAQSDTVYAVEHQYADGQGAAGQQTTFSERAQTVSDAQSFPSAACPRSGRIARCLSDDQIGHELARLIDARHLPTGVGANAPIYIIVLPPSVNLCVAGSECATNDFCGYHTYTEVAGQPVLYEALPTISLAPGQTAKDCQWDGQSALQEPNGSLADLLLSTLEHEEIETIANPLMTGWYQSGSGSEIADMCASAGALNPAAGTNPDAFLPLLGGNAATGTAYDQVLGGHRYYLQSIWSNAAGGCALRPAATAVSAGLPTARSRAAKTSSRTRRTHRTRHKPAAHGRRRRARRITPHSVVHRLG